MKKALTIFAGIVLLVSISLLFYGYFSKSTSPQSDALTQPKDTMSSLPITYAQMTIPFLRNQKYHGVLNDMEEYERYAAYTSYLTNYTSDKLKINGLLTIPKGDKPEAGWPAIVFVHGYIPPTQYVTTEKYLAYVDALARSGFVVFKIDLRGHGTSDGIATGAYFSSDYIIDVLNARSALAQSNFVNKNKIGVWGHSMAGNVLLRAIAVEPDIPAIVIWAGAVYTYTDMQTYGLNDNSYRPVPHLTQRLNRRNKIIEKYGQYDADNIFWRQFTAIPYLDGYKGAIELHHAVDDEVVNIKYSTDLAKILTAKNITHTVFKYESGGHNIDSPYFETAMQRTIDFFRTHLKE